MLWLMVSRGGLLFMHVIKNQTKIKYLRLNWGTNMLYAGGTRWLEWSVWINQEGRMSAAHSGFIRKAFLHPSAAFDSGSQIARRCRSHGCLNRCCSWEFRSKVGWGGGVGGGVHTGKKPLFREQEALGGAPSTGRTSTNVLAKNAKNFTHATQRRQHVSFTCHLIILHTSSLNMMICLLNLLSTHIICGHNLFYCLANTRGSNVINGSVLRSHDAFSLWRKGAGPGKCSLNPISFSGGSNSPPQLRNRPFNDPKVVSPRPILQMTFDVSTMGQSKHRRKSFPRNTFTTYATEADD